MSIHPVPDISPVPQSLDHKIYVPRFHASRLAIIGGSPQMHFVLPGMGVLRTPSTQRIGGRVYLEDWFPVGQNHNLILGQFLDDWGHVENLTFHMFNLLTDRVDKPSTAIVANLSNHALRKAMFGIGTAILTTNGINHLEKVLDTLEALTTKRNIIVHGLWMVEIPIWARKGQTAWKVRLLREVTPLDHRKRHALFDLRQQKNRRAHCMDLRQIIAASRETYEVGEVTGDFIRKFDEYKLAKPTSWQFSTVFDQMHIHASPTETK